MNPGRTGYSASGLRRLESDIEGEALAARCGSPCLITAPSAGVVEAVARRVHRTSSRADAPLLKVAARAFPADPVLLRPLCANLIQGTSGGSLLLTDIEDLPPVAQEQFMDLLDDLQRTGPRSIAPIRLIAGTTAALGDRIAGGTFADHLFYRLNVIHVVVRVQTPEWRDVQSLPHQDGRSV